MNTEYLTDEMLQSSDTVWMSHPASRAHENWMTAIPLGNGTTGALVYGAVGEEVIRLTRCDHWAGSATSCPLPEISASLQTMRDKMDRGDYLGAQTVMMDALSDAGYKQSLAEPFPMGQLRLVATDVDLPFTHYRRALCMDTAETFTRWQYGQQSCLRRAFVSQKDGLFRLRITDDKPRRLELLAEKVPDETEFDTVSSKAIANALNDTAGAVLTPNRIYYSAVVEGKKVGFAVDILPGKGCTTQLDDDRLVLEGQNFTLNVLTFTEPEDADIIALCDHRLNAAQPDYETALCQHIALWKPQYTEVTLQLADRRENPSNEQLVDLAYEEAASPLLLQKLWCFARYLFLSGTAANTPPFALYGLWYGRCGLPWTQNVANENVEIIYSSTLLGGCFDAWRALIDYYYGYLEEFRQNAQKLFGCRGIFIPAYTAPQALSGQSNAGPSVPVPVILNWISCGGWLTACFMDYYRFSHDEQTLRDKILPLLLETGRFYLDYVKYDENGKCRIYPSVSPENTPENLMPKHITFGLGHPCPAVENATMDFAVMKQTLLSLLEVLRRPEYEGLATADELTGWQKLLGGIPDYQLTEQGAIKEWMHPALQDRFNHRHVSHMFPVYPGKEVRRDNQPRLIKNFEIAARSRILGSKSNWAFVHMAALWARLGDGETALQEIDTMCKSCLLENFFTLANDWRHMGASMECGYFAPVQLDGIMGVANALQELLILPAEGALQLFPALPSRLPEGCARGLFVPQGRAHLSWKAGRATFTLESRVKEPLTVMLPDGKKELLQLQPGCRYELNFEI